MNAYGRPVDGPKLANEFVLHNIDDPNEVITLFELEDVQKVRENFENRQMWHQAAIDLGCGFLMSPCLRDR